MHQQELNISPPLPPSDQTEYSDNFDIHNMIIGKVDKLEGYERFLLIISYWYWNEKITGSVLSI